MTTYAVVDPRDIRDDADTVELGLTRQRGVRFTELVDEVFHSNENERFRWFGMRAPAKRYTRRQIGVWLDEILNNKPRSKDNAIRDWYMVECVQMSMHGFDHYRVEPVRELIRAARDLNVLELRVEAHTMRLFEDAYASGEKASDTEE